MEDTGAWDCGRPDPRTILTSAPLDPDSDAAPFSEEELVRTLVCRFCRILPVWGSIEREHVSWPP